MPEPVRKASLLRYQRRLCEQAVARCVHYTNPGRRAPSVALAGFWSDQVRGGFVGNQRLVDPIGLLDADLQLAGEIAGAYFTVVREQDLARLGQQTFLGILLARQLLELGLVVGGVLRLPLVAPPRADRFDLLVRNQ